MSRRGRGGRGGRGRNPQNHQNHQNRQSGPNGQTADGQRHEQRSSHQQTQQQARHDAPHASNKASNKTANQGAKHASNPQFETDGLPQGHQSSQNGRVSLTSALQPRRSIQRPATEMMVPPRGSTKIYKAVFYDTLNQAKADLHQLTALAQSCDQLNIIVRAESSMDDADLNAIGKLFCGAAWALIHERRKQDGWYDSSHEC
jgi:hypothetical protein